MLKFTKCPKCLREYSGFICPNRCDENKETKIDTHKVIKNVKEKKQDIKKDIIKRVVIDNNLDTFKGLKLYTASELNNKLKKDYNSIKNEKICIKYGDRYILHSDIIEQFKTNLNIDGNT